MYSLMGKMVSKCWKPLRQYVRMNKDDGDTTDDDKSGSHIDDGLFWSRDLEKHFLGDFSFAVAQANMVIEDHSQVETAQASTFVGVYDGHGGPDASRFISDHLFLHLMRHARDSRTVSEDTLRSALSATENGFLSLVRRSFMIKPGIASMGSCCLVGIIWEGTLYVANLGDSRAVIGFLCPSKKIVAQQLTTEHNASMEEVREELRSMHPNDSDIVVMKQGVWRVKGIIQVSRTIGDAYLKGPEFSLDPTSFPHLQLSEPLRRPVLTAEPSLCTRVLKPEDQFIIFASDGLWEHLTNQEAVQIVYSGPRAGAARRLIKKALKVAAKKAGMKYEELKKVQKEKKREYHDDITVVVIFLDPELLGKKNEVGQISLHGFVDTAGPSKFSMLQEMM